MAPFLFRACFLGFVFFAFCFLACLDGIKDIRDGEIYTSICISVFCFVFACFRKGIFVDGVI